MIRVLVHLLAILFNRQIFFIQCAEVLAMDYEKLRAQNIMRNNQVLQRLGVTALASIVSKTSAKSRGDAHQESRSLYEVHEGENSEDEEVNQVPILRRI